MIVLPVQQYPTITPVQVTVSATYPGADSKTLADSVASPIEAQINGVDNMLYMSSTSSANGQLTLTVYFSLDTDPDIAQVQVQNRVNLALPQLPDRGDAARRLGAEEVVVDHDADRRLRQGRPLQRRLHRQLRQRLRARRAEARAGRRPGVDHGRARPGDAHLDEPGPHGLARHHHQRHRQRDQGSRTRCSAPGQIGQQPTAGPVELTFPVVTQAPFTDPRQYEQHHPAREPGRQRDRAPGRRRARRGRAARSTSSTAS